MRILWFTNTPCKAIHVLTGQSVTSGGWLYSLSEYVSKIPGVELHIAFYWGKALEPFIYESVFYHPILRKGDGNKVGRLINRFRMAYFREGESLVVQKLQQVVNEINPDLIHIHGSEDNFGLIASNKQNCPVVLSIQGILSVLYDFLFRGYSKKEIAQNEGLKAKVIMNGVTVQEHSLRKKMEREKRIFSYIDHIIGRTFWDRNVSLAFNPYRHYYEVGEILRPAFFKAHWNKKKFSSPLTIISTTSAGYYKGFESILRTAQVLKSIGFSFQWNVIGLSYDDNIVHLAERVVGININSLNIGLLGRKDAVDLAHFMEESDIFAQVSHMENSSNSLCEAMLLGMPIIATFAGGTASILVNNQEGILVQDGDPYVLAGAIVEMANNTDIAIKMGENAAKKAATRHAPETVCSQLMNVYTLILQNHV